MTYDFSIHRNPDARAWAKFFIETVEGNPEYKIDEENMVVWFANAMMAMHDHIVDREQTDAIVIASLKEAYSRYEQDCYESADEIERLRKYERLVQFIATDYVELSHDKVQNEYILIIKKCRELVKDHP
jgi:hypothetical protein